LALFAVRFLDGIQLSQQQESSSSNILLGDNRQRKQTPSTIGLILGNNFHSRYDLKAFTDEAVTAFCNFLQNTTSLSALHLSIFPAAKLRRLLTALHTNTSVKELKLECSVYRSDNDIGLAELLCHRTNYTVVHLERCHHFDIQSHILPFPRQGSANLQTLFINNCNIG
jgi:hypothetical protein